MSVPERHRGPGRVREVTSHANPQVKEIRALALKKFRDQSRSFMAEGLKLVIDALDAGWTIRTLVYAKAGRTNPSVAATAARVVAAGGDVLEVSEKIIGAITRRDNPQMAVGVFEQRYVPLSAIRPSGRDLWLALDRIRDPGNLGTIIRTVDAAGASGVILIGETTDPFAVEAVRATMGSIFAVPLVRAGEEAFMAWCKANAGVTVYGSHLKGAVDYRGVPYDKGPLVLAMGNEQQGLTDSLASACHALLRIPQAGKADSLNLAVATGIMLFEARRSALSLQEQARP